MEDDHGKEELFAGVSHAFSTPIKENNSRALSSQID
jgi:hypothetical protein